MRAPLALLLCCAVAACSLTGGSGDPDLVPPTLEQGDEVLLPLTFPDGTTADLEYPDELELAELGVFPYSSGLLRGESPVARDFWIRRGDVDDILELRNDGEPPELLAEYAGADGQRVGFWDFGAEETRQLSFQFGAWTVLVYDYVGAAAMSDPQRASWAASFSARETPEGFLILDAVPPLRLAAAGEHAGPQLTFSESEPRRELTLYPGSCTPHEDQDRVVGGKRVQWSGEFADWCLSESLRVHASGEVEFVGALIRSLGARNVVLATG
jgi:hypothetical protein